MEYEKLCENGEGSNRQGGEERDGKRNEEQEEQPRALEEQQGPPDARANRTGMPARAQSVIHEGPEGMGRPAAASFATAEGAGMERIESRGSESSKVAVEQVEWQAVPTLLSGIGTVLGPSGGSVGRGNTSTGAGKHRHESL